MVNPLIPFPTKRVNAPSFSLCLSPSITTTDSLQFHLSLHPPETVLPFFRNDVDDVG